MKKAIILLMLISVFFEVEGKGKLTIEISQDQIGLNEPIFYDVYFKNNSNKEKELVFPWNRAIHQLTFYYRIIGNENKDWEVVDSSVDFFLHRYDRYQKRQLAPKEEVKNTYAFIPFDRRAMKYLFDKECVVEFKAVFRYEEERGDFKTITSNREKIKFIKYSGVEKEAVDFLKSKNVVPFFMYSNVFEIANIFNRSKDYHRAAAICEDFIKKFPDSKFTNWVKLFLAYDTILSNITKRDETETVNQILKELINIDDPQLQFGVEHVLRLKNQLGM